MLASAAATQDPFRLSLGDLGGFPSLARPRVVYVEIAEGRSEVELLVRAIDLGLQAIGLPRSGRPFVPHVTLWRIRNPRDLERFRRSDGVSVPRADLALTIGEILLKSSELRPSGPQHQVIGRWPLRRPSPAAESGGSPSPGRSGPLRHD